MIQQASSIIIKITVVFFSKMYYGKKKGNKSGVLGDFIKVAIKKARMNRSNKSQRIKPIPVCVVATNVGFNSNENQCSV
jgi:hypothetical protein